MAGKIEIRKAGQKFRFVVVSRQGTKLAQSELFDDKPSAKRGAKALSGAVSGAEIVDTTTDGKAPAATKPKPAARRTAAKRK
jgi:uncharacterized protein YegP (UPF0339 family)